MANAIEIEEQAIAKAEARVAETTEKLAALREQRRELLSQGKAPVVLRTAIVEASAVLEEATEEVEVRREKVAELRAEAAKARQVRAQKELREAEAEEARGLDALFDATASLGPVVASARWSVQAVTRLRVELGLGAGPRGRVENALISGLVSNGLLDSREFTAPRTVIRRLGREAA